MSIVTLIDAIATTADPRARWELIKAALSEKGLSLRTVAKRLGVCPTAVSQAAILPSERIEQAIALALGASPATLFPDRYDETGRRTVRTRRRTQRAA